MSTYNDELFEGGRSVSPEEAMHELMSAVILRGVLDYRDECEKCVVHRNDEWYISESGEMKDLERFFKDINFKLYPRVRDGVLEFMKDVYETKTNLTDEDSEVLFKCPICNGDVTGKLTKVRVHAKGKRFDTYKKFHCSSCLFSTLQPCKPKENTEVV